MSYPPGQDYRTPHPQPPAAPGWAQHQQPWQPPTPPPPPKRRAPRWVLIGLGVVVAGFLALAGLGAILEATGNNDTKAAPTGPAGKTNAAKPPAAAPRKPGQPVAADFVVSARVVNRTCYGAQGCDITWMPTIVYTGPAIKGATMWVVSYEVVGAEAGTSGGAIVYGSVGAARQTPKTTRTAGEDVRIALKVTGVEKS